LKKIPIIGLVVGAVAAVFIKMKGNKSEPETAAEPAAPPASAAEDTTPPA
jgi:hypothetical protein